MAYPMDRVPVNSTDLAGVGYDDAKRILEIEFRSGAVYEYGDVPPTVYAALMAAASHGKYFNQFIRKGPYSCVRVK